MNTSHSNCCNKIFSFFLFLSADILKIFGDFLFYMYICKIYYELYLISLGILTLFYMFVFSGDFLLMLTVDRLGIK